MSTAAASWERLPRAARRGLQTLLFSAAVGVLVGLLLAQPLGESVLYAVCVSLAIWAFIDGGRLLAARWVHRHEAIAPADPHSGWPGWGWMGPVLVLGTLGGYALGHTLAGALLGRGFTPGTSLDTRMLIAILLLSMLPGAAVTLFFRARGRLASAQAAAERAERIASEQRLALLASQLEPHMLFNTLANLRVLIGIDPPRAQAMLDRLILFLRATLDASRQGTHTLGAEFERLRDYLELMQIRMGARLAVQLELPDALRPHPVPALLLQPLVENAIKHGLEAQPGGGRLFIGAAVEGDRLVLRVRDTGAGLPAAPTPRAAGGFGLEQVRERLQALHGERAGLELATAPGPEGGTLATIRLPL